MIGLLKSPLLSDLRFKLCLTLEKYKIYGEGRKGQKKTGNSSDDQWITPCVVRWAHLELLKTEKQE